MNSATKANDQNGVHSTIEPATTVETVYNVVVGYPHMTLERGRVFFDIIRTHNLQRVLELGFNHGVSTSYIAAAVASLGGGYVVTIDRLQAVAYNPGLEHFLARLGLHHLVTPFYETTTYNWRLRDFLRMDPRPVFDLVFLDGAHIFEPDALAFLLAEKMLSPGGWFVFDDINWSIATSPTAPKKLSSAVRLTDDEFRAYQVREVIDVLVRRHPNIAEWREDEKWGYARKKRAEEPVGEDKLPARLAATSEMTKRHALENFSVPIDIAPGLEPVHWQAAINRGVARNAEAHRTTARPDKA